MIQYLVPLAILFAAGAQSPKLHPQPQAPEPASITARAPAPVPAQVPAQVPAEGRISAVEAKKALDEGKALLVDVRGFDVWQMEHAKGALSIPVNEIVPRLAEMAKDKLIITYCTCHAESSSAQVATVLRNQGFEKTAALVGGLQAWKDAGYEVESKPAP